MGSWNKFALCCVSDLQSWTKVLVQRVICVLQLQFEKSTAILLKSRCHPPPHLIQLWKSGETESTGLKHCIGDHGRGGGARLGRGSCIGFWRVSMIVDWAGMKTFREKILVLSCFLSIVKRLWSFCLLVIMWIVLCSRHLRRAQCFYWLVSFVDWQSTIQLLSISDFLRFCTRNCYAGKLMLQGRNFGLRLFRGHDNRGGLMSSALEGGRVARLQMLVVITTFCSWAKRPTPKTWEIMAASSVTWAVTK